MARTYRINPRKEYKKVNDGVYKNYESKKTYLIKQKKLEKIINKEIKNELNEIEFRQYTT